MESSAPVDDSGDVALAAMGDRRAFERLYRVHVNRVFTLCSRMCGSRIKGEELTQDVFVRTWEKLPQFRGDAAFSTWIHRIAVNIVLTDRKNEGRNRERIAEDELEGGETPAALTAAASFSSGYGDMMDLSAAIEGLPPGSRRQSEAYRYRGERIASCERSVAPTVV